jgi:hypothetical protein
MPLECPWKTAFRKAFTDQDCLAYPLQTTTFSSDFFPDG